MKFPYPYEVVAGADALARLQALRDAGQGTTVILGGEDAFTRLQESQELNEATPAELLAQAADIDPLAWLAGREEDDAEFYELEAASWPDDAEPNDALSAHVDVLTQQPLEAVYIATLPTQQSWEAACYLRIGGWNEMPHAPEHSALWRLWAERYGARVACIADDVIEFVVERPPQTREDALALARQQYIYCPDIVQQGTESVEVLAATLLRAPVWYFWWD